MRGWSVGDVEADTIHARVGVVYLLSLGGVGEHGDVEVLGYTLDEGFGSWDCTDEGSIACFEEVFCFVGVDSRC